MRKPAEPRVDGPALRTIRLGNGIPAARMARDLGISPGNLHDIETGRRGCRDSVLRAMAAYLGVPPSAITLQAA